MKTLDIIEKAFAVIAMSAIASGAMGATGENANLGGGAKTGATGSGITSPARERVDGSRQIDVTQPTLLLGITVSPGSYTLTWSRVNRSASGFAAKSASGFAAESASGCAPGPALDEVRLTLVH